MSKDVRSVSMAELMKQMLDCFDEFVDQIDSLSSDKKSCPGIEIEPGVYSGCSGTGGDCPVCGK